MTLPVTHFSVLDSTNEEAKRLALAGTQEPLWIHADQQTRGRGRRAKVWQSPAGNLAATGLYHWDGPLMQSAQLGFAAALAVSDTLLPWLDGSQNSTIKWPNDVLLGGAKIAGILLETGAAPTGGHWVAVGIGINLAQAPADLPYPATALNAHLKSGTKSPTVTDVLDALITNFESWRMRLMETGFAPLRTAWLTRAHGLGKSIRTSSGQEGVFEDLSTDGALVLRTMAGQSIEIGAGEVFFAARER